MKKFIIFILFLVSTISNCHGQYYSNYNKVWAFGYKAGLDFTSGSPVPIATGIAPPMLAEGCASVCDSFGHLLFYTNGSEVYNRNHVVMPGATAVPPFATYSTTQGALILPMIVNPRKYYVFSLQQGTLADTATCRLVYSVVDMSLDGGLGDVVSATKATPLADSLCEKMMAVTGNDHNIWLMVHKNDTALFLAYEITAAGIAATPVVSATGSLTGKWGYLVGTIKASPNRRKIVSQSVDQTISLPLKTGTELYDFNPATGIVSNCVVLDSVYSHYGAEFSPDNTKLYSTQKVASDTMQVFQYNIALATPNAIRSSKTSIAVIPRINASDIKLGPDGKMYFSAMDTFVTPPGYSRYLDRINSPNLAGAACGYIYRAVSLAPGTGMQLGLPNLYVTEDTNYVPVSVVDKYTPPAINIYPNPATTVLTVSSPANITHISISNLTGQEVYHSDYNSEAIKVDISTLRPGCYFIKINGTEARKFTKL
jgi:hypothetical protein